MFVFEQQKKINIDDWLKDQNNGQCIFSYLGSIDSAIILDCIQKLENFIAHHPKHLSGNPKTAVYLTIESIQNIYHHGLKYKDKERFGAVKIISTTKGLQMDFLNIIHKDKAILLGERIQQLNVLSKDELKKLHLLILSNNEYSNKGGGGLGLVDVARKINTKLSVEFFPLEKNLYLYLLKINLN